MKTEEIIEVLQAYEDGKELEVYNNHAEMWLKTSYHVRGILSQISKGSKIRVKPEPKINKMGVYAFFNIRGLMTAFPSYDENIHTHRITYNLVDGEPDLESFKIEKL